MRFKHFIAVLLLLIVGAFIGITGSNLGVANNWQVVNVSQHKLVGHYQGIRSDEWGVLTAISLSQMCHKPAFPVINKTIDVEGKNMLIVHDYGVPVKHISALARPTTWGYFTGSIRFGMAWSWLFPIFIGFVGISLLLNLLLGVQKINMVYAIGIVYAPICAAWSNCSLYELGLGAVAAWAFLKLLASEDVKSRLLFSLLCGWSAAAFALTLYIPRLIPMSWFYVVFLAVIIVRDGIYCKVFDRWKYILLIMFCIGIIMVPWYLDAKEAIMAMLKSAYPGSRIVTGGSYNCFDFVRGWFPYQLVDRSAPFSNQSELSAFPNLLFIIIPLLGCFWSKFTGKKSIMWLFVVLLGFICCYQYIGFPVWLAKITAFGKSHPHRMESTVMMLQICLLLYFLHNVDFVAVSKKRLYVCIGISITLYAAVLAYVLFSSHYTFASTYLLDKHQAALILTFELAIYAIVMLYKNWRKGMLMLIFIFVLPGFIFNPISIAPKVIISQLPDYINKDLGTTKSRVLFLFDSPWEANTGYCVGLATLDGVHHYVDGYMYENFYGKQPNGQEFNRFNHAFFKIDKSVDRCKIEIPQGDCIRWRINPVTFVFSSLPVKYVIANRNDKTDLVNNESLQFIEEKGRFAYFEVRGGK